MMLRSPRRLIGLAVLVSVGQAAVAAPAPGDYLSFVACPIARDTGPSTDLCFLTEWEGVRYALVNPADWGNPQLRHRVLVEGRVGDGPQVCGATAFVGRASVLAELDPSCDLVLPFDGKVVGAAGGIFNSGPPEQRARMAALADRALTDPTLSIQPVMPDPPQDPAPSRPYAVRSHTILYPFDSDRGSGPDMLVLRQLAVYAQAARARVTVVSRQGVSKLSNGERLAEASGMAKQRADKIVGILEGLGVPAASITARIDDRSPDDPGGEAWRDRRIEVTVSPGSSYVRR